jgi:uncharacterized membrane-anchored protein
MSNPFAEIFHPQYRELHAEPLSRPFPVVSTPVMVAYRAVVFTPAETADHAAGVAKLAELPDVEATPVENGFQLLRWGSVELRIERHTEFTAFTAIAPQSGVPFARSAADYLPENCLDTIPGKILVAVERVASVWSHFRLDDRGATRFLVQGHRLTPGRYGRLLQRLVEIETYRMAALLSLPLARELLPQVEALEARHVALVERIGAIDAGDERALLGDLTNLSLTTERLQARCGSRFSLTDSYARILSARVRELREEQVPGYQTIGEFFDRRLSQAWHTCETAEAGLNALSVRLESTTGLLRTRVEVNLQSQNQSLLASVDRRAAAQLRLQHNVEGLSVVVLTYYLANLLKLAMEGTEAAGAHVNSHLMIALALPLVAGGVWWMVRAARNGSH